MDGVKALVRQVTAPSRSCNFERPLGVRRFSIGAPQMAAPGPVAPPAPQPQDGGGHGRDGEPVFIFLYLLLCRSDFQKLFQSAKNGSKQQSVKHYSVRLTATMQRSRTCLDCARCV
jgi:hypothetical protein